VATISADGVLTGLSHGSTTITAAQQTVSATMTVPVVNSYTGSWSGTYQIRVCDQSGSLADARWCQSLGGVGAVLPATLVVEQPSSADFTRARGTLALESLQGPPIPGVVTEDGHLNLGGSFNVTASGVMARMTIGGWDTALDGRTVMVGRWAQSLAATAAAGGAYMENEIVTMNRTGPVPGAGVDSAPPTPYTLGWDDFIPPLR
jgi:hypothetical protein